MNDFGGNDKEKITLSFDFGGIGLIIFIVFLILKLTGVIDWKWILVFLPIIIPVGVVILALVIVGILYLIAYISERISERK